MPLTMMNTGETRIIRKISCKDDSRRFLHNLGFVEGAKVTIVSEIAGNMIINIKDSRIALDRAMARKIFV